MCAALGHFSGHGFERRKKAIFKKDYSS